MTVRYGDLPRWTWDLLVELVGYEDIHAAGAPCVAGALEKVPAEVVQIAEAIGRDRGDASRTTIETVIAKEAS